MKQFFLITFLLLIVLVIHAQVTFIGHRGASYLAPENTVSSAKLAWELDADAVELDINLTKDNRIMVIHDGNTKRTSGEDYIVKNSSSKVLRKLDVGSLKGAKYKGEKIPFLKEMLRTIPPGKKMVVELKCGPEVLPFLQKVVRKSGKQDQLVFISFGWQAILDTKLMFPQNECYLLCSNKDALMGKIRDVSKSGLDGVDLKNSIIDKKVIDVLNKYNLKTIAWTVDDPEEAVRLIKLGVSAITTNRPAWLKKQLWEM